MEHLFLMFLDHTKRRTTVGRTPLDEWSARRRDRLVPSATGENTTRYCKYSQVLLMMGENIGRNM